MVKVTSLEIIEEEKIKLTKLEEKEIENRYRDTSKLVYEELVLKFPVGLAILERNSFSDGYLLYGLTKKLKVHRSNGNNPFLIRPAALPATSSNNELEIISPAKAQGSNGVTTQYYDIKSSESEVSVSVQEQSLFDTRETAHDQTTTDVVQPDEINHEIGHNQHPPKGNSSQVEVKNSDANGRHGNQNGFTRSVVPESKRKWRKFCSIT